MKVDPILMKATLAVEVKRKHRIHREEWRKRENMSLQEEKLRLK